MSEASITTARIERLAGARNLQSLRLRRGVSDITQGSIQHICIEVGTVLKVEVICPLDAAHAFLTFLSR